MKSWQKYTLAGIVGAILGGVGTTFVYWNWTVNTLFPVTDLFAVAQANSWVSAGRNSGDSSKYEDALHAYISVIDTAIQRDVTEANQRVYRNDKALALIRLSALAASRGARDEAENLSAEATSLFCGERQSAECNPDSLSELARKIDQSGIGGGQ